MPLDQKSWLLIRDIFLNTVTCIRGCVGTGCTPLHWATIKGNGEAVAVLVEVMHRPTVLFRTRVQDVKSTRFELISRLVRSGKMVGRDFDFFFINEERGMRGCPNDSPALGTAIAVLS